MSEKKTKKKSKLIIILLIIVVIIILLGICAYSYYNDSIYKPISETGEGKAVHLTIDKGSSSNQIAEQLYSSGLIKNMDTYKIYLKLSNLGDKMQAGKYELNTNLNAVQITDKLVRGEVLIDTVKVTIPEGFTVKDIAAKFEEAGLVSREEFMNAEENGNYDYSFLKDLKKRPVRLEGYLFPDTYEFEKNVTAEEIIDRMLGRFDKIFNEEMRNKAKQENISIDDAVIMASIVEKEARVDAERPVIAGVYYNRLSKNMLLQADATIIYIIGWKDRLLYDDLKVDSPYNTYKYPGLPEGPIANPGRASLEAAVNPEKVNYLYYILKNDNSGTHAFTVTYDDFLREKAKNKTN